MDEQLFRDTLKRIRWSVDRDDLAAATQATLRMMLRRPDDQVLLDSLLGHVALIVAADAGGQPHPAAVRQAAVRCVGLLQSAKEGRLNRSEAELRRQRRQQRRAMLMGLAATLSAMVLVLLALRP